MELLWPFRSLFFVVEDEGGGRRFVCAAPILGTKQCRSLVSYPRPPYGRQSCVMSLLALAKPLPLPYEMPSALRVQEHKTLDGRKTTDSYSCHWK